MKKIALLLCAIVMFGCSDDEEKAGTEVPDPEISKMLFSEFCKSDGIGVSDVTKEEEFRYEDAWLTGYTYTQEISIADLTEIISHSLTIQYGNNRSSVTFTDEIGTERKYTLNEEGYATQCEYASLDQKRQYTFSYTDGYLTQVNEKIMPREGSSDAVVAHTLSLQYDKGDLISTSLLHCPMNHPPVTESFRLIMKREKISIIIVFPVCWWRILIPFPSIVKPCLPACLANRHNTLLSPLIRRKPVTHTPKEPNILIALIKTRNLSV